MTDVLALILQRHQLTRQRLVESVEDAGRILSSIGVRPEDRVALQMQNTAESVIVFLALARLGCSVVIADERAFRTEGELVAAVSCSWLVIDRALPPDGAGLLASTRILLAGEIVSLPTGRLEAARSRPDENSLFPKVWLGRPDGVVMITSGSTGAPRLVEKRPGRVVDNALRTASRMRYRPDDVLAPLLPVNHQYGFSVLIIGLLLGLPVVLGDHRRVLESFRLARRHGATIVDALPRSHDVILVAIESDRIPRDTVQTVRHWCVGGAPVTRAMQARAEAVHGRRLLDGYGSTELGNVAHVDPRDPTVLLPLQGIRAKVVLPGGEDCVPGAWGSLLVSTPDADSPRWHSTGDLARMSVDGSLCIAGRDEAMSRGGELVYPAAVEHRLASNGLEAVCVPVSREDGLGEHTLVVVVADPVRRERSVWRTRLEEALPPAWRPDKILMRDSFPLTAASGKVDRRRLVEFVHAHEGKERPASRIPIPERTEDVRRLRSYLLSHRAQVVEILQTCSSREAALIEWDATVRALDGAVGEIVMSRPPRVPESWVYMPSNGILYPYALYLVVPALYTERIVFRPSRRVGEPTRRLHDVLAAVHGLPIVLFAGTQHDFTALRDGRAGTVVFTGKFTNAEEVRSGLDAGQVMVFFGQGTNPVIVGEAADLDRASSDSVRMRLLNSGQDCFGADVHLVHESVAEEFTRALTRRLARHTLDDILASPGDHLAVHDPVVLRSVVEHVSTSRENVLWGGRIDLRTLHLEPVVLSWPVEEAPDFKEVFAPVFNVAIYATEDELRELLRRPFYEQRSMCAALYGTSDAFANWCAERVTVSANATIMATDDAGQALGGAGVRSNYVATPACVKAGPVLISRAVAQHAAEFARGAPPRTSTPICPAVSATKGA